MVDEEMNLSNFTKFIQKIENKIISK